MDQEKEVSGAVQSIAAKLILCQLEAEAVEERQRREGERSRRQGPRRWQDKRQEEGRPREDVADSAANGTLQEHKSRTQSIHRQVRGRQTNRLDQAHFESVSGQKLVSILPVVDLMCRVEDALKWDKHSSQTKLLVDKFRYELNKNYLDPVQAEGGGKKKVVLGRGKGDEGDGKEDTVLRENWVQELEQMLTALLAKNSPIYRGEEGLTSHGDTVDQRDIYPLITPDIDSKFEATVSLGAIQYNKSKKKKIGTKVNRKRLVKTGPKRELYGRSVVRRAKVIQAVPIICPEESLGSIHFEKEPETYIGLKEEQPESGAEGFGSGDSRKDAEDFSKMVKEVKRLEEEALLESQRLAGQLSSISGPPGTNNDEANNVEAASRQDSLSFHDILGVEKTRRHSEIPVLTRTVVSNDILTSNTEIVSVDKNDQVISNSTDEEDPIILTQSEDKKDESLDQVDDLNKNKSELKGYEIEWVDTKGKSTKLRPQEDTDGTSAKVNKQEGEFVLYEEPYVEVREITGRKSFNDSKKQIPNKRKETINATPIDRSVDEPNRTSFANSFSNSLSVYPWYQRIFVSPVTGRLVGYTRRESPTAMKVGQVFYQTNDYSQITREWPGANLDVRLPQGTNQCQISNGRKYKECKNTLHFSQINDNWEPIVNVDEVHVSTHQNGKVLKLVQSEKLPRSYEIYRSAGE